MNDSVLSRYCTALGLSYAEIARAAEPPLSRHHVARVARAGTAAGRDGSADALVRIADAIERLRPGRGLSVDQILGRVPWGAPEPCPCIAAAAASCTAPDCAAAP